jgi:hypothetical protein
VKADDAVATAEWWRAVNKIFGPRAGKAVTGKVGYGRMMRLNDLSRFCTFNKKNP